MRKEISNVTKYIPVILIVVIFIASSFVSQQYSEFLQEFILKNKLIGMLAYSTAVVLAIVVAPLTSIPFVPLVVGSWGVFWTVVVSVVSWTVGSMAAFWIARKFGIGIVKKFIPSTDKKRFFYENIPEERVFWYLIFLRIVIPVDILSYMLGLFTHVRWKLFIFTTLIGVIPVIIFLSFFGSIPFLYQIISFASGILIILFFVFTRKLKTKNRK